MQLLYAVLTLLHIITGAAWFGLGLRLTTRARTALDLGADGGGAALVEDGGRTVFFMNLFIVLTLVFSYALLGTGIGIGRGVYLNSWVYHTSATLILVIVGVQFVLIRSGWNALADALGTDADAARSARSRVVMGTGIGHLTWLVILTLMLWNQYFTAAL
jgi:hypothetical protein